MVNPSNNDYWMMPITDGDAASSRGCHVAAFEVVPRDAEPWLPAREVFTSLPVPWLCASSTSPTSTFSILPPGAPNREFLTLS